MLQIQYKTLSIQDITLCVSTLLNILIIMLCFFLNKSRDRHSLFKDWQLIKESIKIKPVKIQMIGLSLNQHYYSSGPIQNKARQPDKDPIDPALSQPASSQNKLTLLIHKLKQHKTITILVVACCILATIIAPLVYLGLKQQTMIALITASDLNVSLQSGISMKSSLIEVVKQSKKVNLTANFLSSSHTTRILQESTPISKFFSYYHKDSEILVTFCDKLAAHVRIPETGIDFVIPSVPQQSEQAFYQMPLQLPLALIKALSKVSGKKITITTDVSYDGVYNKSTNQYTLLTHKKPYHPEQFGKIQPHELNLLEIKPIITNYSDIIEVTAKIAEVVTNIVNNTKLIILQNKEKLMNLVDSSISKAANHKGILAQADKVLKCARLGEEVMRCPESVWRSGELKVKNINDPDPVQIMEIVIDIQ